MIVKEHWPSTALEEEKLVLWQKRGQSYRTQQLLHVLRPCLKRGEGWPGSAGPRASSDLIVLQWVGWSNCRMTMSSLCAGGSVIEDSMEETLETATLRPPKSQGELQQTLRENTCYISRFAWNSLNVCCPILYKVWQSFLLNLCILGVQLHLFLFFVCARILVFV